MYVCLKIFIKWATRFFGTWPRLRMSRFSTFVFSFGIQGGSTTGRCSNPDEDHNIDDVNDDCDAGDDGGNCVPPQIHQVLGFLFQTEVLCFNLALTIFSAAIAKSNFENNGNGSVSILRLTMMFESMSEYGNDEGNIGGVFKITNLGTR